MSDPKSDDPARTIILEYDLDAPPQKVWRAISDPALRRVWLPDAPMAEAEATLLVPGRELSLSLRDAEPPFLESAVTLRVLPGAEGGTRLRILHRLVDARTASRPPAANGNSPRMALAA